MSIKSGEIIAFASGVVVIAAVILVLIRRRKHLSQNAAALSLAEDSPVPSRVLLAFKDSINRFKEEAIAYHIRDLAYSMLSLEDREPLLERYPVINGRPILDLTTNPTLSEAGFLTRQNLLEKYLKSHAPGKSYAASEGFSDQVADLLLDEAKQKAVSIVKERREQ